VQSVVAELTRLDTAVGDGDCGLTFERAATRVGEAVAAALRGDASEVSLRSPRLFLLTLGACLRVCMGGTSGAIFDIMTCAAAAATPADATHCEPAQWTAALHAATEAAMKHGNAAVGDATMIDALHPAVAAMQRALAADAAASGRAVLAAGADAAHAGAAATATMVRGAGRASYVSADAARGIEDPGAVAIATLLRGLAAAV
jgi:dihydroxyacetone kinase